MAAEGKESFTLSGEKGKVKGKIFHFDQAQVVIGRSDSCDLMLADESVSRQHATIALDGEDFAIKDSSTNGTFVNGERIRGARTLKHGDTIGIGPDNVLRYERKAGGTEVIQEARVKGRSGQAAVSNLANQLKSFARQKPLLAGGLGVYSVLILFLFIYFALSSSGRDKVTAREADRLVNQTGLFLARSTLPDKGAGTTTNFALAAQLLTEGKVLEGIEKEDPGAGYVVLTKYRQALRLCGFPSLSEYERIKKEKGGVAGVPEQAAQAVEGAVKRILGRIHELTFVGWLAEGHGRKDEAIRAYERVLAVLPEEEAPSYRFALGRIRDLKR